jgi:hypothetical protein
MFWPTPTTVSEILGKGALIFEAKCERKARRYRRCKLFLISMLLQFQIEDLSWNTLAS